MIPLEKDVAQPTSPAIFLPEDPLVCPDLLSSSIQAHIVEDGMSKKPYGPSGASLSPAVRSTASSPASRSISPNGRAASPWTIGSMAELRSKANNLTLSATPDGFADNSRDLILRSFVPHIAVHASQDTDDLAEQKGIKGGFGKLMRPFGDLVQGKVVVRDSTGANRSWDNFGVRFLELSDVTDDSAVFDRNVVEPNGALSNGASRKHGVVRAQSAASPRGGDVAQIEKLVEHHLSMAEPQFNPSSMKYSQYYDTNSQTPNPTSPFYALYLRRLLSGVPITPHETFSHPVACIIAISSRNPSPIEALRELYSSTSQGNGTLLRWVNNEFLRYYLLVHDEDRDDIAKSTALFDQMKRHFGLHCHMLRLRSSECVPSDDDSVRLPYAGWISAAEELVQVRNSERIEDTEDPAQYLFESDFAAIRTFVREMVTQSVVPFMESRVIAWNDQVASRRRGISGRFMSLSKRWTGFGSVSRSQPLPGLSGNASQTGSNYDSLHGFYGPDTAEATMRKLADYAFMLRDWKLAHSTYELLRTDFGSDKAWKYHAGANEMAAISILLGPQAMTAKARSETVDQMLETASYSYITRCSDSYAALRCLSLGVELLRLRGGSAADDAAKWATRVLDFNVTGVIGHALFTERVAACYNSRLGAGSAGWGSRRRKSALWNVLASELWLGNEKYLQSERCLNEAERLYDTISKENDDLPFSEMREFVGYLRRALRANTSTVRGGASDSGVGDDETTLVDEHSERMGQHGHRRSLIGADATPFYLTDTGPLSPLPTMQYSPAPKDGNFQ